MIRYRYDTKEEFNKGSKAAWSA